MNILGVYFGHDANAALVRDGEVIFHVEASRHTRRKHDHGCHGQVIQKALDWAGVTWKDIDVIAIGGSTIVFIIPSFFYFILLSPSDLF